VKDETLSLLEEGLRHHVLGDDEKAAACFLRILEFDPGNDRARRLLELVRRPKSGSPEVAIAPPAPVAREPDPSREDLSALLRSMQELHELGDFSGSLSVAEKILELEPNHPLAQDYLARNRKTLTHLYESKLASVAARPRVVLRPDEILWLNIDHRAGFLLSQIDGKLTVEDLYALSGMSRMQTAKILAELLEAGVIEMS